MTTPEQTSPSKASSETANKTTWRESFANAASSSAKTIAKFSVPIGTFITGLGLAFSLTNMYNNNEKEIIDSITSSTPSAPIMLSENLYVIPSDTSLTIISNGIPCEIPLQEPAMLDVTLGNTGEATVSETTSILQTLGITSDSHLTMSPAENAEAILSMRYSAAAACRADILRAQEQNQTHVVEAEQNIAPYNIDAPDLTPGIE